jgi:hypothetical protein
MLWDVDLSAMIGEDRIDEPPKVILPPWRCVENKPKNRGKPFVSPGEKPWDSDVNPNIPAKGGLDLCR